VAHVVSICMVKDEADIIGESLRLMAREVDALIVADNASSDGTRDILADLTRELPLTVLDDPEVGYFQSRKMSALAARAAAAGADVVVPHDADERWYSPFGRLGDVLGDHPAASVFPAAVYDHVATGHDPAGDPITRMGWRRATPIPLAKVACRPLVPVVIHQGNHGADYGATLDIGLVVRHFPYRSADQFIRKVRNGSAAYALTDLPESVGAHWRGYGRILEERGADALADEVFRRHFWVADPTRDPRLIYDPSP
jgi:glycosyltransferase involved in cell wall biosynthesis